MALVKEFLEQHDDGVVFYRLYSNCGKNILQVETGNVYGEVCITDDDTHTYNEVDPEDDEDATNDEIANEIGGLL